MIRRTCRTIIIFCSQPKREKTNTENSIFQISFLNAAVVRYRLRWKSSRAFKNNRYDNRLLLAKVARAISQNLHAYRFLRLLLYHTTPKLKVRPFVSRYYYGFVRIYRFWNFVPAQSRCTRFVIILYCCPRCLFHLRVRVKCKCTMFLYFEFAYV